MHVPSDQNRLQRRLKTRHISMIAIGGSIGTGIFLASGNAIYNAGPGGAVLAYLLMGLMVYFLMTSLGEMSTLIPVSGTFCDYSARFVDPAFGFAMSYTYWFNWAITAAVDLSSASFIMGYWFPHVPFIVWSIIFFCLLVFLNLMVVGFYGESEYWLSMAKVITILVFIAVGICIVFGLMGQQPVGFHNWTIGDAPFHRGWIGFLSVILVAGFSFQGTEIFGVTAGEAKDPKVSIPSAIKSIFWRILLFYILSMIVISFIIPYTDHTLMNPNSEVALSPVTLIFQKAGLWHAASLVNFIILTAVLSAGNASMYTAARILWYLSKKGQAPRCFFKLSRSGVPMNAVLATAAVGSVVFLSSLFGKGNIFIWLVNISSLTGFMAWIGIAISHYRFRRAYIAQGRRLEDLPYQSNYFPFAPIFALIVCIGVVLLQQISFVTDSAFNWGSFIGTYIGIPVFLILYLGYRWMKGSRLIPLQECSFEHDE